MVSHTPRLFGSRPVYKRAQLWIRHSTALAQDGAQGRLRLGPNTLLLFCGYTNFTSCLVSCTGRIADHPPPQKRPDLRPPRLNIVTRDAQLATPGYLFTAPTFTGAYSPDSGPYIFDTNGVSPNQPRPPPFSLTLSLLPLLYAMPTNTNPRP